MVRAWPLVKKYVKLSMVFPVYTEERVLLMGRKMHISSAHKYIMHKNIFKIRNLALITPKCALETRNFKISFSF